jgi:Ca-activated chloride channel family protein
MSCAFRAAALALLSLTLAAQQPTTLQLNTRLVTIALNVTSNDNAPIPNLNASDVELTEDNRPQRIAFFDQPSTTPLDIVLAIDASESVAPYERLERAAARDFIHSLLRPQDRIALIAFADSVDQLTAFTNNPRRIDTALGHIHHGHSTALYDALTLASQRLADTPAAPNTRRVIVLITDGENTTHHGSYTDALQAAQRAGATIYSLIVVPVAADAGRDTGGEHALIQLATDTGGKFYNIHQQSDLTPAFANVSTDLRTQYDLGYYAPQPNTTQFSNDAPQLRHIHLQLRNPILRAQYTLRYRTAYDATPQP